MLSENFILFLLISTYLLPPLLAKSKGRGWIRWFFIGICLPIISVLILLMLPSIKPRRQSKSKEKGLIREEEVVSTISNDHIEIGTYDIDFSGTERIEDFRKNPEEGSVIMSDFETSGKTNLKTLEGSVEIFVDKLEDLGVLELENGETVEFGTYLNSFSCVSQESTHTDDAIEVTKLVECKFYENPNKIYLKVVNILDQEDRELLDRELYWFDEALNDDPSQNEDWSEILENMDIFEEDY